MSLAQHASMLDFPIIDAHAHIIPRICGRNRFGALSPLRDGRVLRGDVEVALLPEELADCAFPPEALLEVMERENVAKAVLLQNPTLGECNDAIRNAVQRHPNRFCGTIQVDPRSADAVATLQAFASPNQSILKLELSYDWGWTGLHEGFGVDEAGMRPVWKAVGELGLDVIVDTGPPGNPGYQVEALGVVTARMPQTHFVLAHLGYLTADQWQDPSARARRRELLELAQRPNVWLGLSAVPGLLNDPYPCPRTAELLNEAAELVGPGKLIWGSDLPLTLRGHAYRELLESVATGLPALGPHEYRLIFHDNAVAAFRGLGRPGLP